jgi:hypothetical protein
MIVYPLLLACALAQDSPKAGSPAADAMNTQLEAGEHAKAARLELEALEEVLTQEELSAQDLGTIRARLESAKVEAAEAEAALDETETALID